MYMCTFLVEWNECKNAEFFHLNIKFESFKSTVPQLIYVTAGIT